MMKKLIILLWVFTGLISCNKDSNEFKDVDQQDKEEIEQFIANHNLDAQSTASGLYYVIDKSGTGPRPDITSTVTVKYKGYLTNGSVFDQNDQGFTTSLQNVIAGWQEGIPLFKEGGEGMLLVPSKLGYGGNNLPGIPPYSVLIFEIELVKVYP